MQVHLTDEPSEFERLGDYFARLTRGTVRIDDPSRSYLVDLYLETTSDVIRCRRIAVQARPGAPDVGTLTLRDPRVPRLLEAAAPLLLYRLLDPDQGLSGGVEPIPIPRLTNSPGKRTRVHYEGDTGITIMDVLDWAASRDLAPAAASKTRPRRTPEADLRRFAEIVRSCMGRPYMQRVMDEMHLSPDQARKWKRRAIEAGYL